MKKVATRSPYRGPILWLGGSALVSLLIGLLFGLVRPALLPESLQGEVIVLAIPFIGIFAAIILVFILAVALLGQRFHRRVPLRTHRPVELTTIAGILIGIVAMFQPWSRSPYQYGFSVLLYATLAFIVWSHVAPRGRADDDARPDFSRRATSIALAVALVVAALLFAGLAVSAQPQEPYGMRQRRWDTLREEQKIEVRSAALREYRLATLPALLVFAALPGLVGFFLVREIVTPARPDDDPARRSGNEPPSARSNIATALDDPSS